MHNANSESPGINPFPGLRPFNQNEQHLFFGRESQVDAMVDKLADNRLLAVVGASGSGKSSLVNCGLIPGLHYGLMSSAGTAWRVASFRPGADPVYSMAHALAQQGVLFNDYHDQGMSLTDIVDATLRMSKLGLVDIIEQASFEDGVNLLLIADQFEELFRYQHMASDQFQTTQGHAAQAIAFVNLLLEASRQQKLPVYIVLTMRSDFFGECTQFDGLAEAINAGQYLVPRMTREQRREAIRGPVAVAGAEIAPVLLNRLVNDVGDNPDQLSILQHALNRTWAYREQHSGTTGPLELEHYKAVGSMSHALDRHADHAYAELESPRQQRICETIFRALTDQATDSRGVRRPTRLQTLCELAEASEDEVIRVIDVFRAPSRSFLMPPAGVALKAHTVIDISHESLMRVWQRLRRWTDDEAKAVRMYSRLSETAILNEQGKAGWWREPDLGVALQWRDEVRPNRNWAERYYRGFDEAMQFLSTSEKMDRKRKRNRELITVSLFGVFLALAGFIGFDMLRDKRIAEKRYKDTEQLRVEAYEARLRAEEAEDIAQELKVAAEKARDAAEEAKDEAQIVAATATIAKNKQAVDVQTQLDNLKKNPDAESVSEKITEIENSLAPVLQSGTRLIAVENNLASVPVTCLEVVDLEPVGCEANIFKPGKVFVFAKIVIPEEVKDEKLSLRWYRLAGDTTNQFSNSEFAVARNPNGYRVSSYRTLRSTGAYRACFFDAGGLPVKDGCVDFKVSNQPYVDATVSNSAQDSMAAPEPENDGPGASSNNEQTATLLTQEQQVQYSMSTFPGNGRPLSCESVVELQPRQCDRTIRPGRVYIFAKVVIPVGEVEENLTIDWYLRDGDISAKFSTTGFTVSRNPGGYRVSSYRTLKKAGAYSACFFDSNGLQLRDGCVDFMVQEP